MEIAKPKTNVRIIGGGFAGLKAGRKLASHSHADHSYFDHPEWEAYAPGLKTLELTFQRGARIITNSDWKKS